jgi:hypothetical protein
LKGGFDSPTGYRKSSEQCSELFLFIYLIYMIRYPG